MIRVADEDLVQLVQEMGEPYFTKELKRAQRAVFVYAAVLFLAILMVVLQGNVTAAYYEAHPAIETLLGVLPWAMVLSATVYMGSSQVNLLPFMNSTPLMHWVFVSIFAVVAWLGPLWLVMFAGSNSIAKRRLNEAISSSHELVSGPA